VLPFAVAGAVIWGLRRRCMAGEQTPAVEPVATVLPTLEPAAA